MWLLAQVILNLFCSVQMYLSFLDILPKMDIFIRPDPSVKKLNGNCKIKCYYLLKNCQWFTEKQFFTEKNCAIMNKKCSPGCVVCWSLLFQVLTNFVSV